MSIENYFSGFGDMEKRGKDVELQKSDTVEQNLEVENKEVCGVDILFVRHGQASYAEDARQPESEKDVISFEGALTEEGRKQAEATALELIEKIQDPSKEIVFLWTSPRHRAVETIEVIKEELEKAGINVYPKKKLAKEVGEFTDMTLTNEFITKFEEQEENTPWIKYWGEASEDLEGVEKKRGFDERLQKMIFYFQKFTSTAHIPAGQRFKFVIVTHEEVIMNIAKDLGLNMEKVGNGEVLEMYLTPRENKKIEMSVKFGDREVKSFFDRLEKSRGPKA